MDTVFLNAAWVETLVNKFNTDAQYARVASKWEGDVVFAVEADGPLLETQVVYLDLWRGQCRGGRILEPGASTPPARFMIEGPYGHFRRVLIGEMHPMTALTTRKLRLKGDLSYIVRNLPVALDFVRCAREITPDTAV